LRHAAEENDEGVSGMKKAVRKVQGGEAKEMIASADAPKTPKIVIDGIEYYAANLSAVAKGAIASLQFAEARLMALQSELAICQTAQFAYAKGLKAELEGKSG